MQERHSLEQNFSEISIFESKNSYGFLMGLAKIYGLFSKIMGLDVDR